MRIPSLSDLTFNMSEALPLQEALLFPERARGVAVRGPIPKTLTRFRRVMHLDLEGASTLPAWLGTLRHLRALTIHGKGFKQIPAFIFALPKLKYLFLDDTGLTTLAGIERSRTLTDVTFSRTPLAKQDNEELAASLPGAEAMNFLTGLQFERKPAKPKGKLAALLADDRIDDDADLSRADLHGAVFEDGLIAQKLVRSNLAGTVWRRCDISSDLSSANLTGARFIDCVFDNCVMENAKLAGAVFEHCAMLDLDLTGADLTNAKLTGLDHCPHIDLTRAKARGMLLAIEVLDQSEIDVLGPKADLRGATIVFDLTAEQRKAKARKTSSKLRWKTGQFKGAKLDDATQLIYQQLPAGKTSSFRIDPLGPRAEKLGRIDASNASLWVLIADGGDAAGWFGSDEAEFARALAIEEGPIKIGNAAGVIAQVGDKGWSHIWRLPNGDLALLDHDRKGGAVKPTPNAIASIGARVAQLPIRGKATKLGTVVVRSGALAILLPYTDGAFTAAERKRTVVEDDDRVRVQVPNGTYDVWGEDLGPEAHYEDEFGEYGQRLRIGRRT